MVEPFCFLVAYHIYSNMDSKTELCSLQNRTINAGLAAYSEATYAEEYISTYSVSSAVLIWFLGVLAMLYCFFLRFQRLPLYWFLSPF